MTFFEPLPYSVSFNGKQYALTPSFDNILRMYGCCDGLIGMEQVDMMLHWLIKGKHPLSPELLAAICDLLFPQSEEAVQQKSFDYIQDSPYIYAAFLQAYGIDLYKEQGRLHWWQFLDLLAGLPKDTRLSEIIQIRLMEIPKATAHNAEQRMEILRLKAKYQLKLSAEERQRNLENGLQRMASVMLGMGGEK